MDTDSLSVEMARIDPAASYYAITLLGLENGTVETSAFSHFVRFTDNSPKREIREASLVKPDVMASNWRTIGQTCVVVNEERHVVVFTMIGGNALVERSLAEKWFGDVIAPNQVVVESLGYRSVEGVEQQALNHALTPKLRMQVLERDQYRCRVCGERPADNVHVTLHVHHIRPWGGGLGGMTVRDNLITVCHTCHAGFDPHYRPTFASLIGVDPFNVEVAGEAERYRRAVERYRAITRAVMDRLDRGS
jgi:hypothetical protein